MSRQRRADSGLTILSHSDSKRIRKVDARSPLGRAGGTPDAERFLLRPCPDAGGITEALCVALAMELALFCSIGSRCPIAIALLCYSGVFRSIGSRCPIATVSVLAIGVFRGSRRTRSLAPFARTGNVGTVMGAGDLLLHSPSPSLPFLYSLSFSPPSLPPPPLPLPPSLSPSSLSPSPLSPSPSPSYTPARALPRQWLLMRYLRRRHAADRLHLGGLSIRFQGNIASYIARCARACMLRLG